MPPETAPRATASPNPVLVQICQEAQRRFEMPICWITLADRYTLWLTAVQGLRMAEMPPDIAFCTDAILNDEVFVIPDMLADERFKNNPWVCGEPHLRFYSAAPLTYIKDTRLGSLGLLDTKPGTFSRGDKAELLGMADRIATEIAWHDLETLRSGLKYSGQ